MLRQTSGLLSSNWRLKVSGSARSVASCNRWSVAESIFFFIKDCNSSFVYINILLWIIIYIFFLKFGTNLFGSFDVLTSLYKCISFSVISSGGVSSSKKFSSSINCWSSKRFRLPVPYMLHEKYIVYIVQYNIIYTWMYNQSYN